MVENTTLRRMRPTIYEVKQIGNGTLNIMPCPRSRHLATDLKRLAQMGVNKVVCLLEDKEVKALGTRQEKQLCHELGLDFVHFPIPDRGLPHNDNNFFQLAQQLYSEINTGTHITIHCYAGIGRTGIMAGTILLKAGMSAYKAIELMSNVRGQSMPQTQSQYDFLLKQSSRDSL